MNKDREAAEQFCRSHDMEMESYSIRQVCEAVGMSRAMLIELEQKGFLIPAKVNPDTGYRYYDAFNISKIEQYQTLRLMGFSQQDAFSYFDTEPDQQKQLLDKMTKHLELLQKSVDAFSLRLRKDREFHVSLIHLNDVTCYCRTVLSSGPKEGEVFAYRTYEEAISKGYRLLASENMFLLRLEFARDREDGKYLTKMCIPIDPAYCAGKDMEGVELIKGGKALSVLCCGNYQGNIMPNQGFEYLLNEVKKRNLTIAGALRQISVVVPGVNILASPDEYVLQLAVPVE